MQKKAPLKRSAEQIIDDMVRRIIKHIQPQKIILFGSYARGTADSNSDVDLLIVMSGAVSRRQKAVEIHKLLAGIGLSKDIVVVTPEEIEKYKNLSGTLIRPALMEGKVVYDGAA